MPIPDDWDGFSVCDYAVRWPDSNIWRIILRGLLTNPALADFWDPNTGDVAQVLEDFEPIVNYVLNSLECGDMNIPIGSGMEFFGSVLPDKFLWQDGSKVTVEAYPELYAVIGNTYASGSFIPGEEFYLPRRQGRVAVGLDTSQTEFNILGKTGGEKNAHAHD